MQYVRSLIILAVLVLVLAGVLVIAGKRAEAPAPNDTATTSSGVPMPPPDDDGGGIVVLDSFENNTHTYTFDVYLPTPCHKLSEPDVRVAESFPEQIYIDLRVITPDPDIMCVQVLSRVTVTAFAKASAQARLTSITLNGNPITFDVSAN